MSDPRPELIIYTDGACSGNPGPGGWGAVLLFKDSKKEIYGSDPDTTNNRMELSAAIEALNLIKRPLKIEIRTDSKYLEMGVKEWIFSWAKNDWRKRDKSPIKNLDLWKKLYDLIGKYDISWSWVKAHSGDLWNEKADSLAVLGKEKAIEALKNVLSK